MKAIVARILYTAVILGIPALCSQAAEIGFYVGGSYGNGSKTIDKASYDQFALAVYNDDDVGFVPDSDISAFSSIDKKNPGYGFMAGYRLNQHLAVEGGYLDLGKFRYQVLSNGGFRQNGTTALDAGTLSLSVNSKTAGFTLAALGILPLSYRWEIYGRAGILLSSNERTLFLIDDLGRTGKETVAGSSTDLLAGAGAGFTFAEIYTLRGEYQRVFDAGDSTVGEGDQDLATLGVTVRF